MKKTHQFLVGVFAVSALACATPSQKPIFIEDESSSSNHEETITNENPSGDVPTAFTDSTVIGTQVWATQNLSVLTFQNGDTIMEAKTNEEWVNAAKSRTPAWCYHDKDNGELEYGKMYNYWAVVDSRGLAPKGWRIPTVEDFTTLANELHATGSRELKSSFGWEEGGSGNNNTGFNALPAGYRNATGLFNPIGRLAAWWTTDEKSSGSAFGFVMRADDNLFVKDEYYKRSGLHVRCLR